MHLGVPVLWFTDEVSETSIEFDNGGAISIISSSYAFTASNVTILISNCSFARNSAGGRSQFYSSGFIFACSDS